MSAMLSGARTHLEITANLQHPPMGQITLAGVVLSLPEARDLHRRLGVALARLDVLLASVEAHAA